MDNKRTAVKIFHDFQTTITRQCNIVLLYLVRVKVPHTREGEPQFESDLLLTDVAWVKLCDAHLNQVLNWTLVLKTEFLG